MTINHGKLIEEITAERTMVCVIAEEIQEKIAKLNFQLELLRKEDKRLGKKVDKILAKV